MLEFTKHEFQVLYGYHTAEADYYLSCKQTNAAFAKRDPQPKDTIFTSEQWEERAAGYAKRSKYHRSRARQLLKLWQKL